MIRRMSCVALVLVAMAMADIVAAAGPTIVAPPPGSGPVARAHTRTWRHRRSTGRITRRTPEVMREDAARIKRGDLFSTWSNAAAN